MKKNRKKVAAPDVESWEEIRRQISDVPGISPEDPNGTEGEVSPEVMELILSQRASQLAREPVQEAQAAQVQLVVVRMGRSLYGFDVATISDIRPVSQITRVPRLPAWVAGVVNIRGRILSVVDLNRYLGLPEDDKNSKASSERLHQIVVETPKMEIALLVNEVLEVRSFSATDIQEASGTIRGIHPEYVHGIITNVHGYEGVLLILDLVAILADKKIIIEEEIL